MDFEDIDIFGTLKGHIPDLSGTVIFWTFTGAGIFRTLKGRVYFGLLFWLSRNCHILDFYRCCHLLDSEVTHPHTVSSWGTGIFVQNLRRCHPPQAYSWLRRDYNIFWTEKGLAYFELRMDWHITYKLWRDKYTSILIDLIISLQYTRIYVKLEVMRMLFSSFVHRH